MGIILLSLNPTGAVLSPLLFKKAIVWNDARNMLSTDLNECVYTLGPMIVICLGFCRSSCPTVRHQCVLGRLYVWNDGCNLTIWRNGPLVDCTYVYAIRPSARQVAIAFHQWRDFFIALNLSVLSQTIMCVAFADAVFWFCPVFSRMCFMVNLVFTNCENQPNQTISLVR